jgi:hypothetical protein
MGAVDVADARVRSANRALRLKEDDFIWGNLRRWMRWRYSLFGLTRRRSLVSVGAKRACSLAEPKVSTDTIV